MMLFDRRHRAPTLFLQWSRPVCRYLLCKPGKNRPHVQAVGSFERDAPIPLDEQLKLIQTKHNLPFRQVVLLLSRPEIDLNMMQLPPATPEEVSELVRQMLHQDDESSDNRVSDFVLTHNQDEGGCEALVFTCPTSTIKALGQSLKNVNASLSHVTFSGLGAVHLLRSFSQNSAPLSIVVAMGDEEIDISIESLGKPAMFRTISRSSTEDHDLGHRLCSEIHRSLSLVGELHEDAARVYLMGSVSEQRDVAEYLTEHLSSRISVANPLDQIAEDLSEEIEFPSRYANLIGAALAWNQHRFDIDLLHPHFVSKSNPTTRRLVVGGLAASALLGMVAFLAWEHRTEQITEIAAQKQLLRRAVKTASKVQDLQRTVQAVEEWRSDDIIWLDELRDLSAKLPKSDEALIGRVTMSVDNQGQGIIDMAVQVKSPEIVAALEDAVRGNVRHKITSKRVSEGSSLGKFPWQFETRIQFTPPPLRPLQLTARGSQTAPPSEPSQPSPSTNPTPPPHPPTSGEQP